MNFGLKGQPVLLGSFLQQLLWFSGVFLISKCFPLSALCLSYKHTEFAKPLSVPRVAARLGPCSMAGAPSANLAPITLPISSQ